MPPAGIEPAKPLSRREVRRLRLSRANRGRGAHREEDPRKTKIKTKKTHGSQSRIGVPSGTLRRAPRPPPFFLPRRKEEKEGQSSTRAGNRTRKTPPPKSFLGALVQNKNAPRQYSQNNIVKKNPTSWVAILFSTCIPCGENNSLSGIYTVWGNIVPARHVHRVGETISPNLGCPPPGDATQPAPEPHPPPHHRDAHPDPHPKQESKP